MRILCLTRGSLFEWQAITTNPEVSSNLKNFLLTTFEDLLWMK